MNFWRMYMYFMLFIAGFNVARYFAPGVLVSNSILIQTIICASFAAFLFIALIIMDLMDKKESKMEDEIKNFLIAQNICLQYKCEKKGLDNEHK